MFRREGPQSEIAGWEPTLLPHSALADPHEPTHGPLRAVVGRYLDCGLLEHGFARVRCEACRVLVDGVVGVR